MSVGLPVDKNVLDARVGNLAWQIRDLLTQAQVVKAWLDATPDATLQAAPYSYTAGEVATIKSAFADLNTLALVSKGQATLTPARDLFAFAGKLTGLQ